MEKKSIGAFIAVLRKANGLTQQDLADRLNVSNKTVSKWERDESYPDLSIIPEIAEMFGVTCDEILSGQRSSIARQNRASSDSEQTAPPQNQPPNDSPPLSERSERQVRRIADGVKMMSNNIMILSIALTAIGYIIMLAVGYSFFRPLIGFGILAAFSAASLIVGAFIYNNLRVSLGFEDNGELVERTRVYLFRRLFVTVFINIIVLILGIPFTIGYDVNTIITFDAYLRLLPVLLGVGCVIMLIGLIIFDKKLALGGSFAKLLRPSKAAAVSNIVQAALCAAMDILMILSAFLAPRKSWEEYQTQDKIIAYACISIWLALALGAIISATVFAVKKKRGDKTIVITSAILIFLSNLTGVYITVNNGRISISGIVTCATVLIAALAVHYVIKWHVISEKRA